MARNRVIGINNSLPWHLPADFKHFKQITMGKPVVMGRLTYESIGKPLPGRMNIIVTNNKDYRAENANDSCVICHTLEQAISTAKQADEIMIIGGASFYTQALPYTDRMYLTIINEDFEGDAWFPEYDTNDWLEIERIHGIVDSNNSHAYDFITLDRKK